MKGEQDAQRLHRKVSMARHNFANQSMAMVGMAVVTYCHDRPLRTAPSSQVTQILELSHFDVMPNIYERRKDD